MFVLNSDISIGSFRFSGVHEVAIARSIHSIVETATIRIPAIAAISVSGKVSNERIVTATKINEGDPVTIRLGYNGDLKTEFRGFVKHRKFSMPFEVECEGYSWMLRNSTAGKCDGKISLKSLLEASVEVLKCWTKISTICDKNMQVLSTIREGATGFDVINEISKITENNATCFFRDDGALWCGLIYSTSVGGNIVPGAKEVAYRIGFNTLRENTLTPHNTGIFSGIVTYLRKKGDGTQVRGVSTVVATNGLKYSKVLNQVMDSEGMKVLANEKAHSNTYTGYEGSLVAFLQPYAAPGDIAMVTNSQFTAMDGAYLIESTEVSFGIKGARRNVELGPRIGPVK